MCNLKLHLVFSLAFLWIPHTHNAVRLKWSREYRICPYRSALALRNLCRLRNCDTIVEYFKNQPNFIVVFLFVVSLPRRGSRKSQIIDQIAGRAVAAVHGQEERLQICLGVSRKTLTPPPPPRLSNDRLIYNCLRHLLPFLLPLQRGGTRAQCAAATVEDHQEMEQSAAGVQGHQDVRGAQATRVALLHTDGRVL